MFDTYWEWNLALDVNGFESDFLVKYAQDLLGPGKWVFGGRVIHFIQANAIEKYSCSVEPNMLLLSKKNLIFIRLTSNTEVETC